MPGTVANTASATNAQPDDPRAPPHAPRCSIVRVLHRADLVEVEQLAQEVLALVPLVVVVATVVAPLASPLVVVVSRGAPAILPIVRQAGVAQGRLLRHSVDDLVE